MTRVAPKAARYRAGANSCDHSRAARRGSPGVVGRSQGAHAARCSCFFTYSATGFPEASLTSPSIPCDLASRPIRQRYVVEAAGGLMPFLNAQSKNLRVSVPCRLCPGSYAAARSGADYRPCLLAGFVGQDLVERLRPVGLGGRGLECDRVGFDHGARRVLHLERRSSCFAWRTPIRRSRRTRQALEESRYAFVALAAGARGPVDRRPSPTLVFHSALTLVR